MSWLRLLVFTHALFFLAPVRPFPQENLRPLTSEEVGVLPQGSVDLKLGFEFARSNTNPFYSRSGYTLRIPTVMLDIGLGGIAEIQFAGDAFIHFRESISNSGDHEETTGDFRLFTKIRFLDPESQPLGLGAKIGVKLPNISDETGLGSDETDFFVIGLLSKPLGGVHLHASTGLGILGDPIRPRSQHDVFLYSVAVDVLLAGKWRWMAEGRGLAGSGVNSIATVYTGVQRERKAARYDCGVFGGLTEASADVGISCGLSLRRSISP